MRQPRYLTSASWRHRFSLRATVSDQLEAFPLFPLGVVLLPREVLPLHIFEDRYRTMIGECIERGTQFGIVWLGDDGLAEVGCAARVAKLLERFDDGRMNILAQGSERFRLLRRVDDLPYPAGDIELLPDDDPEEDADAGEAARASYADLVERATGERPSEVTGLDAYGMAATLDFALEAKQELLELRTESERMERLGELFTGALERLEQDELAAERARGNGRVRFHRA